MEEMTGISGESDAKGWKQLKALELINAHTGTFTELTALVSQSCFPETHTEEWVDKYIRAKFPNAGDEYVAHKAAAQREGKARHLVRYLFKHQDTPDPSSGKKQTLRAQGRIILPGKELVIKESMGAVIDDETGKSRKGAAKPKRATPVKLSEEQKTPTPVTKDRVAIFRQAQANLRAKEATKQLADIAAAGAHRFKGAKTVKISKKAPASSPTPEPQETTTSEKEAV